MFFGQYEHTIDDKGRLMIPRKMRMEIGDKVFVLNGFDGSLSVYKEDAFVKLVESTQNLSFNLKNSRDYIRNTLGSACEVDVDKLGRMSIPTQLKNRYNIAKDVVVIGVGDHFEIWNKDTFSEYQNKLNGDFENIAENVIFSK